jgi:hypothetical protein
MEFQAREDYTKKDRKSTYSAEQPIIALIGRLS